MVRTGLVVFHGFHVARVQLRLALQQVYTDVEAQTHRHQQANTFLFRAAAGVAVGA